MTDCVAVLRALKLITARNDVAMTITLRKLVLISFNKLMEL